MYKEGFKISDLVEVPRWTTPVGKNWVIVGFSSNGTEAILWRISDEDEQVFIPLSDLEHQKEPEDTHFPALQTLEDQDQEAQRQDQDQEAQCQEVHRNTLTWVLNRLTEGLANANFDANVGCIKSLIDDVRKELDLPPIGCIKDGYRQICKQCTEKQRNICKNEDV